MSTCGGRTLRKLRANHKSHNWPSLNNRGERITLINQNEEIISSVVYNDSWYKSINKDDGGYSLEIVDVNFHCRGEENWMASIHRTGGTPGNENSVKDELNDLSDPEIDKIVAISNSSATIYLSENIGPQNININNYSITPDLEIKNASLLSPDYSDIQMETTATFILPEPADSLDLVINEILFNPWSGGVDFVEIYNQSDKYIDLNSLSIGNDALKQITKEHIIIEPKQHIAITEDPSILNNHYPGIEGKSIVKSMVIPAFNDDKGNVILVDINGKQIDYFHYNEDFHSNFLNDVEGVSLERISYEGPSNNQSNW